MVLCSTHRRFSIFYYLLYCNALRLEMIVSQFVGRLSHAYCMFGAVCVRASMYNSSCNIDSVLSLLLHFTFVQQYVITKIWENRNEIRFCFKSNTKRGVRICYVQREKIHIHQYRFCSKCIFDFNEKKNQITIWWQSNTHALWTSINRKWSRNRFYVFRTDSVVYVERSVKMTANGTPNVCAHRASVS